MRAWHVLWVSVGVALGTAACTTDEDTTGSGGAGTGTGSTSTGTGGTGGSATGTGGAGGSATGCRFSLGEGGSSCTGAGAFGGGAEDVVDSVTADILEIGGGAAANIVADVCGTNRCVNATADGSGHVVVDGGGATFETARLLYGDGRTWVKFAAPLPSVPNAAFGTIHAVRLPALGTGVPFQPGQEITSGDVTLALDASAYLEFNTLYFCTDEDQAFRAATIPLDGGATLPAFDTGLGLELAYGLTPIDTTLCPPAQMVVPNDAGWPANAEVEFYLQGTSVFQEYAPYGGWQRVSDGVVSATGDSVRTNAGEGIPQLGVVGIRLKP